MTSGWCTGSRGASSDSPAKYIGSSNNCQAPFPDYGKGRICVMMMLMMLIKYGTVALFVNRIQIQYFPDFRKGWIGATMPKLMVIIYKIRHSFFMFRENTNFSSNSELDIKARHFLFQMYLLCQLLFVVIHTSLESIWHCDKLWKLKHNL